MLVSMSCLFYGMGAVFQKEPPYDLSIPQFFIIETRQCIMTFNIQTVFEGKPFTSALKLCTRTLSLKNELLYSSDLC
jgi:hypothetical protein